MSRPSCVTCVHFEPDDTEERDETQQTGRCFWGPPTPVKYYDPGFGGVAYDTVYPRVGFRDVCNQHKRITE